MLTLLLLSIALASDGFAIAVSYGASSEHHWRRSLLIGLIFGLSQSLFLIIGWLIGSLISNLIQNTLSVLSGLSLVFLGILMIKESTKEQSDPKEVKNHIGPIRALIGLIIASMAISIDCLVAGVALPLLGLGVIIPSSTIFIVTFIMSIIGYCIGSRVGQKIGKSAEVIGGLILIIIGLNLMA